MTTTTATTTAWTEEVSAARADDLRVNGWDSEEALGRLRWAETEDGSPCSVWSRDDEVRLVVDGQEAPEEGILLAGAPLGGLEEILKTLGLEGPEADRQQAADQAVIDRQNEGEARYWKHADPLEEARWVSAEEAEEIRREDPSLIREVPA